MNDHVCIKAQKNLILNGGFEDTLFCSYSVGNINQFNFWHNGNLNTTFTQHACNTSNVYGTHSGEGCAGNSTYFIGTGEQAGYSAGKLNDTLKIGKQYCFSLYMKVYRNMKCGSDNFGVFFGDSSLFFNTFFVVTSPMPQLTLSSTITDTTYHKFQWLYTANGTESDFMIGAYKSYGSSNYPVIYPTNQYDGSFFVYDDFSMMPSDINLGHDTTICSESDSLLIGEPNWIETKYKWYANGILIDTIHGQLKIKPNSTTTYIVQKETSCITTFDTLLVTYTGACPIQPSDIKEPVIPNVFSPNGDDVNESWRITLPNGAKLNNLEVYNRWGNIVFTSEGTIKPWFGRTSSGEACSEGVYFFVLRYTDTKGEEQKKNGYISLFR